MDNTKLNTTRIHPSPGIFFDHLATINFCESTWKLVTYLNLDVFEGKIKLLENNIRKTKEICAHNSISSLSLCNTSLVVIEKLFPLIQEKDQILRDLSNNKRDKRGLINGIGTIFKSLFGTLDQDDADYYNTVINKVESSDQHLVSLLKEQVQIVHSTIRNFNTSITNVERNNLIFDNNFNKLYNMTKSNTENYFKLNLKQLIEEHLTLMTLVMSEINNEYSNIVNAILFAKTNQIHPVVISPNQYLSELTKTIPYLPPGNSYALPLEKRNILTLLSLINVNNHFHENKIIFVINTPLVNQLNFDLFKLIPIPTSNNLNHHFFILPQANYLAISEPKTTYTFLENLDGCKTLGNKKLICMTGNPKFSVYTKPSCETDLLSFPSNVPKSCDIRVSHFSTEMWYPLSQENTWLYVLLKPTTITLTCNHQSEDHILNKTGIVTVDSDCKVYTSTTILTATRKNSPQSNYKSILPKFDIMQDDCCNNNNNTNNVDFSKLRLSPSHLFTLDRENLNFASHKLDQLSETVDKLNEEVSSPVKIFQSSYFAYVLIICSKIAAIYFLYKLYKYCRKNRRHSHENNCISNCITFNYCKKQQTELRESIPVNLSLPIIESSSSTNLEINREPTPRRSQRLSNLKTNVD